MLIEDDNFAHTMGRNARRKAQNKYSKEAVFKLAEQNPFLILGF